MKKYDFSGWATRTNLRCSDGRTICKDAFKANDGQTVPLVWNHQHNDPLNVLGHALLENRKDGVYAYCTFNDTESGQAARKLVEHGDVSALSIYANQLRQQGGNVLHGMIREVSLVLAGANPGAYIESILSHGEESDEEAVIYTGENILMHSADDAEEEDEDMSEMPRKKSKPEDEETVADVFNTLTEKQKTVVYALIGQALEDQNGDDDDDYDDEEGGTRRVKHNVFETDNEYAGSYLSHADEEAIVNMAKASNVGSFQTAMQIFADENGLELQHDATSSGFVRTGDGNIYNLFPEYKEVRPGAPELITNDQGWVNTVMNKVHKSPISRIRTSQVDIRNIDSLRAKGYQTGKQKTQMGNFTLVRRTTDPQTVYVKNALHRDDIVDITDFNYVDYLYGINRAMLNEELATAMMLGDGRSVDSPDKISPDHIRPIWTDDELYTIHKDLDLSAVTSEIQGVNSVATFGSNYLTAEAMVNTVLYARENYKGSGTPDMFITPHMLNVMLLARDINGRRIYSSKAELASSLNVGEIYTAEQFVNKTRTTSNNKTKKLLALIVNLADYSLGATKGGEVTHFTQFDIDFNQEKSLLETRVSGALTRVYSAIAIEEDVTTASTGD